MPTLINKIYISIDVETNGPCPGIYSMIEIGAMVVDQKLNKLFFAQLRPQSWSPKSEVLHEPEALKAIGRTHEETLNYPDPVCEITKFNLWLHNLKKDPTDKLVFVSDNNGFDWQFVNYYFYYYLGHNPFGYSSLNLNSLYKGLRKDFDANIDHLRDTDHTHNALEDSMGNAEAMLKILEEMEET